MRRRRQPLGSILDLPYPTRYAGGAEMGEMSILSSLIIARPHPSISPSELPEGREVALPTFRQVYAPYRPEVRRSQGSPLLLRVLLWGTGQVCPNRPIVLTDGSYIRPPYDGYVLLNGARC